MYLCYLWEIHSNNGGKNYWYCYKIQLGCSRKRFLVYQTDGVTGELVGNITVKQKALSDLNLRNKRK